MLVANNVMKSYRVIPVLSDVHIELKQGSLYGLMGPNGAGKTTLIKVLTGIFYPDKGEVLYQNKNMYENEEVRHEIAYVPDGILFYSQLTVKDMKEYYQSIYRNWNEKRYQNLRQVFSFSEKKRIKHMSKGMKTQLSILMALSTMPKVILMDEPTSGLDPIMRREVLNLLIQDVSNNGTSILVSTHNISELEQICDRVGFLDRGKMFLENDMEELKDSHKKIQVAFQEEMPDELAERLNLTQIRRVGKVYEMITDSPYHKVIPIIESYEPILLETLDMTLEEIFIHKMGGQGYGFQNITL